MEIFAIPETLFEVLYPGTLQAHRLCRPVRQEIHSNSQYFRREWPPTAHLLRQMGTACAQSKVTGFGPLRTRLQRAAGRGLTRFVGRQREMAISEKGFWTLRLNFCRSDQRRGGGFWTDRNRMAGSPIIAGLRPLQLIAG